MRLVEFTDWRGTPVYVVPDKVTGVCVDGRYPEMVWIQTGPEGPDGEENGWSVKGPIEDVVKRLVDAS